jgi:hypothetical protein
MILSAFIKNGNIKMGYRYFRQERRCKLIKHQYVGRFYLKEEQDVKIERLISDSQNRIHSKEYRIILPVHTRNATSLKV